MVKQSTQNRPRSAAALVGAAALAALLFGGCSQVVRQSYEGDPASSDLKLAAYSGSTSVYGSTAPEADSRALVRDGYARLGVSHFTQDHQVTYAELQSEARDVGADVVLLSEKWEGSSGFLPPTALNENKAAFPLAAYTAVHPEAVSPGPYTTTTVTGPGGTTVTSGPTVQYFAPSNGQQYKFTVSFWRRSTNS
ncbi:MAG TPA: hypothetical protein VGG37_02630 [Opitutaceae bacterium]|jgi:hypothetical protein